MGARPHPGAGRAAPGGPAVARVYELLAAARTRLAEAGVEAPSREARLLLGRLLERPEAALVGRSSEPVPAAAARRFLEMVGRRAAGEPAAYLLGDREFFGRRFAVDRRVLVPRPESEHLIEAALALELAPRPRILDLGTGSGCLAVTLALELPGARVTAVDLAPGALAVARANARRLGAGGRVRPVAADLARGLELASFDLIVSNPPYVDPREAARLAPEVLRFEPHLALFAEGGGLAVVRRLLAELDGAASGTPLLVEIGHGQAEAVAAAAAASPWTLEGLDPDLAGIPRVARLRRAAG